MTEYKEMLCIDLQLLAEGGGTGGGDGGAGASGNGVTAGVPGQQTGVSGSLENVRYGIQDSAQSPDVQGDERVARFEELINGEFKDLYHEKVQNTIQKRLKNHKEKSDKYDALSPTLELLSKKYGVDPSDIEALNKAIDDDDSYFEDEALEKGVTVEQLKEIRAMERENAELKRQMREQEVQENADRIYAGWLEESEQLKAVYPSFDLSDEINNPKFVELLRNNIDVRTAYEVLHKDEIIPAAMQFTAQNVEAKLVNKMRSGQMRPTENGMTSGATVITKNDPSQLTREDREEIRRRVARGERITF